MRSTRVKIGLVPVARDGTAMAFVTPTTCRRAPGFTLRSTRVKIGLVLVARHAMTMALVTPTTCRRAPGFTLRTTGVKIGGRQDRLGVGRTSRQEDVVYYSVHIRACAAT